MIADFSENLDVENIRVQAPTQVIFLCGGQTSDISVKKPLSLRDGFLKIFPNPVTKDRIVVMAEDVNLFYLSRSDYKDLLSFETDLAQICELILLFCESEGSLAELGAFSMVDEIAQRLMVVIRDKYYQAESFIKLGPLLSLENRHGSSAIYVLDDDDIGIRGNSIASVDIETLSSRLTGPINTRLARLHEPSKFAPDRSGHVIKLIVGFIQEFGGLRLDEIDQLLRALHIKKTKNEISGYLLCAEAVHWIIKRRKGSSDFFFALPVEDAAQLPLRSTAEVRDKLRRRALYRSYWKENDADRHRGIVEANGGIS